MQKFIQILNQNHDVQKTEVSKMNRNQLKQFIGYLKSNDDECLLGRDATKAQVIEYLGRKPKKPHTKMQQALVKKAKQTQVKIKQQEIKPPKTQSQKVQNTTPEQQKIERYFVKKYMSVKAENHLVNNLATENPEILKKFYYLAMPNATIVPGRELKYFTSQNMRVKYAMKIWEMIQEVKTNPHLFYEKEIVVVKDELNAEKAKVRELEEEQLSGLEQQEALKQKLIANIQKLQLQIDIAYNEELIQSYSMQVRELRSLLRMI